MGDPKFLNRHAGVSGGAISQDQAYFLNKNLVAIKRPTDLLDNPAGAEHGAGQPA